MNSHVRSFCIAWRLLSLILFLSFSEGFAQDNSNYVMFFVNPYNYNPSYAGVEGRPALYLNYRRQWVNVDGSPKIANLSFHAPVKKFNIGANINNDKRGLFNTSSVLVSGAYTVNLGDFKSMRFGISAGAGFNMLDRSRISDVMDPALGTNAGNTYLLGNAGISFHLKSFHGGISLPAIFQPAYVPGTTSTPKPLQTVLIHASNRFYFAKNKHVLEPHVMYHYNMAVPSQIEAALVYHMNQVLWLGGSYKQHYGSSAFLGFHINKVLGIGYAYSFKTQRNSELNSPSHEVQLTLLFGQRRKDIPFYSFVDTDKEKRIQHHKFQSASEAIAQNRNGKPAVENKPPVEQNHQARLPDEVTRKNVAPRKTSPPVVQQEQVVNKPPVTQQPVTQQQNKQEPPKPSPVKKDPKLLGQMPHVHDTLHPMHQEEKERIARLEKHADNPNEEHGQNPNAHPHAERHEFVKRGNHVSELNFGDYVVAGVFRSEVNAKHFSDGLNHHGFKADFGHLTLKNLWYVYISHTDNIEDAKAARDKYRKLTIFRDSWLLTVHE